jgi:hypothetical protein
VPKSHAVHANAQVRASQRVHCKTVGFAYTGSNPVPATPAQTTPDLHVQVRGRFMCGLGCVAGSSQPGSSARPSEPSRAGGFHTTKLTNAAACRTPPRHRANRGPCGCLPRTSARPAPDGPVARTTSRNQRGQYVDAMSSRLGDLLWRYAGVEPRRDGRVPQVVWSSRQRRANLLRGQRLASCLRPDPFVRARIERTLAAHPSRLVFANGDRALG